VIARTVNGLPALTNSGSSRYKGLETSVAWFLPSHVTGRASYSFHDSRFVDYIYEFDPGVPTQLAGNQHEMSARHLASVGVLYIPPTGVTGGLELNYVGSRYMNMRNTAPADGFATVRGMLGYNHGKWDLRLIGDNLTDQRPPSAESELGDAQYYLLPARRIDLTFGVRF
jgi:outer membrane receptor protein involved in Fe transport